MKKFFFLFLIAPAILNAQVKNKKSVVTKKTVSIKTPIVVKAPKPVKTVDGFLINGNIEGITDGTVLKLLNGNTGVEESTVTTQKGRFVFTGKTASPDFLFFT